MAEKVNIEVGVNGDSASKSVGNIKKELREATAEALRLSRQFGELDPQALDAAKRVTMLKDEISDMNERAALFDPGQKFAVFGNVVNSIAGGFTAAQGAMALFGSESEDLQKQLVKLQGALALTQGLSTLADSWKDFQRLGAIIKSQVVSAFSTLRGAIISTGIGALVVLLGTLIANFDSVEKWLKKVIPGFEGFGKALDKLKAIASGVVNAIVEHFKVIGDIVANVFKGDFSGAFDAAKSMGDRMGRAYTDGFNEAIADQRRQAAAQLLNEQAEQQERELKLRKAQGMDATKLEEDIARNKAAAKLLEFGSDNKEYLDAQTDFEARVAANRKAAADKARDEARKSAEQRLSDLRRQQELEMQLQQTIGNDTYNLRLQQLKDQRELATRLGLETKDLDFQVQSEILNNRKALNQVLVDDVTATDGKIQSVITNSAAAQQLLLENQKKAIDEVNRKEQEAAEIKKAAEEAKRAALTVTSNALGVASELAGEQTAVGKGLAIAQTTISTYTGAQQAFSSLSGIPIVGPALGAIAAAAAIAMGLKNVQNIVKTKVPGGASSSAPSISASAPVQAQPSLQANVSTLVDQAQQQAQTGPQRVYVVESDITDKQDRVAKIEEQAIF